MDTMNATQLAPAGASDALAGSDRALRLTYAELGDRAAGLAARLAAAGLRRGDRVATVSDNNLDQVVLFYACARAGMTLVPLSRRATPTELAVMVADAAPALLAADPAHRDLVDHTRALLETPAPAAMLGGGGIAEVPTVGPAAALETGEPEDPVLLIYTSGSSGRPKGVPLSQANCVATNAALTARFPLSADDVVLLALPQFHVAGWNVQPLAAWSVGARVVVVADFDAATVLELIERERVTAMMGVPTTYRLLAADPGFGGRDLSSLRTVVVGGAPVEDDLGDAWTRHGVRLRAGYGLTEAGPNVLCEPDSDDAPPGWLEPYPGVTVRLDESGQLLVRAPGVFAGYWRNPEATAQALVDGWLATGDLAEERSGRFRLHGRINELYISGGENVHPAEVEHALRRLPGVAGAAVVGVPDERWGEAGVAFVVPAPDHELDPARVRQDLREHLAGFKVPREVVLVPALPQTGTGKIDKRTLRLRAAGGRDQGDR